MSSYELSVWCVHPLETPPALSEPLAWTTTFPIWEISAAKWLIAVSPSTPVLPEDMPLEVEGVLPGIAHVVKLSVRPSDAPKAGLAALNKVAKAIAKCARGVIFDPQTEIVELPSGIKRYAPQPPAEKEPSVRLQMTWFFDHLKLAERASLDRFLNILATHMPEALPRRYGVSEPPAHTLEKTGRAHLLDFLADHIAAGIVWYPNRPVLDLSLHFKRPCGFEHNQYRCNALSIAFDKAALDVPGWSTELMRLWRALSNELRPFFGDVRTFRGYEDHPVAAWWWKGVPPRLGHAAVVGEPYSSLWKIDGGTHEKGLTFVTTDDWRTDEDAADKIGGVPAPIALSFMPHLGGDDRLGWGMKRATDYASEFPFRQT